MFVKALLISSLYVIHATKNINVLKQKNIRFILKMKIWFVPLETVN